MPRSCPTGPLRQVAEHHVAHLVQLGLRQARYRGHLKTEVQLLLAAQETAPVLSPGSGGRPTPRHRVEPRITRRETTARIAEIAANRPAQPVADRTP